MTEGKGGAGGIVAGVLAVVALILAALVMVVMTLFGVIFDEPEPEPEADGSCVAVATEESGGKGPRIPSGWGKLVEDAADQAGMPVEVAAAQLKQESGWDPKVVNPSSGAAGLAQAMPDTWEQYGEGDPLDPAASIMFMGRYMKEMMTLAKPHSKPGADQVDKALAAYNWGPGNMDSAGWDISKAPQETRDYIPLILDSAQVDISGSCSTGATVDNVGDLGDGEWANPLPGSTLVSGYGPRSVGGPSWAQNHRGIDLATDPTVAARGPQGTTVAIADAKVLRASCTTDVTMGCEVLLRFDDGGMMASYAHHDSIAEGVRAGGHVKRGQKIGVEGNKGGWDFGSHLHLEMYPSDAPDNVYPLQDWDVDPAPLLREKGAL